MMTTEARTPADADADAVRDADGGDALASRSTAVGDDTAYAENDRLGGRIRRYARVGTGVGGLAARLAGERLLGLPMDRGRHAEDLRAALGGLKGPLMKAAQILSTIPDALPREYAEELAQLQADAPSMGWLFVKRRMATELGPDWRGRFGAFSREAAAAASLGQVHKAATHDGRPLACKLQYPDMSSAVEADLRQLKLIFGIYRRYDRAINPDQIHAELSARLREELDYGREGRQMRLYAHMLRDEPGVVVPDWLPELSTRRLLTMSWLDGQRLMSFQGADQAVRDHIAMNMFRAWYVPFYDYGVIHGDPHLGNYSVRPDDHRVNLLDFGCIRVFRPAFVKGVIDLYHALDRKDDELAVEAYRAWGFQTVDKPLLEVLNAWAGFLYRPLLQDKVQRIEEDGAGQAGRAVAGRVHAELKRLGGVTPPREFVLMDRAAIGLGSVFMHLKAEINWHRMFRDLIDDFDVDAMARRQDAALAVVDLERPAD
ncbi:ABC transporter ATP-binding protein [Tistrella bauzanensis]|uniref:ABC transporter ATP-binding protein n=2 Tax=Tistrella bauzanensis TaxID=657419 RepID=A0ABQ1I872_9PROT|nr:ABC transporter ATP-binding protein [Tistrella bauzanensis]